MKILAIDTSALTASAAVVEDGTVLGEVSFTCKLNHSQTIMPVIDFLLKGLSLAPSDIDLFACANGPGSFTGLRIGIGTVKGLAYGTDKPAAGVSTLEALAYNAAQSGKLIAPIMDARRNQVYTALYKYENGAMTEVMAPCAMDCGELCKLIKEDTVFVGDGVKPFREQISSLLGGLAFFPPDNQILQRASNIALAAANRQFLDAASLNAIYLRKSQAERERENSERNDI